MLPESSIEYNQIHSPGRIQLSISNENIISCGSTINLNSIFQLKNGVASSTSGTVEHFKCNLMASFDNHLIISNDYEVKYYHLKPLKLKKTLFHGPNMIKAIDISSDGSIAIGSEDSSIQLLNIFNPTFSQILNGHLKSIINLKYEKNGERLISCSNNELKLWENGVLKHSLLITMENVLIEWHPNGKTFCIASKNKILIFNDQLKQEKELLNNETINHLKYSNNGYLACLGNNITIWNNNEIVLEYSHVDKLTSALWINENDFILVKII
jgi:WD40 repeat protein